MEQGWSEQGPISSRDEGSAHIPGRLRIPNAVPVKQKADGIGRSPHALTVGVHQVPHRPIELDAETNRIKISGQKEEEEAHNII